MPDVTLNMVNQLSENYAKELFQVFGINNLVAKIIDIEKRGTPINFACLALYSGSGQPS